MTTKDNLNAQALKRNRPDIVQKLANPDNVAVYLFSILVFDDEMRDTVLVSILKMFFLGYKRQCFMLKCS